MGQRDPKSYAVIGAAMAVHRELGTGFLERVYQDALAIELQRQDVPFQREVELPVFYRGIKLASTYRADFFCYDGLVVETKVNQSLTDIEAAQVLHYLRASGHRVGLLLNFGTPSLQYKRYVNEQPVQPGQSKSV